MWSQRKSVGNVGDRSPFPVFRELLFTKIGLVGCDAFTRSEHDKETRQCYVSVPSPNAFTPTQFFGDILGQYVFRGSKPHSPQKDLSECMKHTPTLQTPVILNKFGAGGYNPIRTLPQFCTKFEPSPSRKYFKRLWITEIDQRRLGVTDIS